MHEHMMLYIGKLSCVNEELCVCGVKVYDLKLTVILW